jgi:hypothetical protein
METKNEGCKLLRTGMSDNANLLSDDELGDIFGGYCKGGYCGKGYSSPGGDSCEKKYCEHNYDD